VIAACLRDANIGRTAVAIEEGPVLVSEIYYPFDVTRTSVFVLHRIVVHEILVKGKQELTPTFCLTLGLATVSMSRLFVLLCCSFSRLIGMSTRVRTVTFVTIGIVIPTKQ
jgi:hypothetical protein